MRAVRSAEAVASRNSCGWNLRGRAPSAERKQNSVALAVVAAGAWRWHRKGRALDGGDGGAVRRELRQQFRGREVPQLRQTRSRRSASALRKSAREAISASSAAQRSADVAAARALTTPSWPPEATQRPSGETATRATPRVCPRYVCTHPRRRASQIFTHVSAEPEAKNSPAQPGRAARERATPHSKAQADAGACYGSGASGGCARARRVGGSPRRRSWRGGP
jgi:hypothetical protein